MARSSRTLRIARSMWHAPAVMLALAAACGVDETGELGATPDAGNDVGLGGGGGADDAAFPDVLDDGPPEAATGDADAGEAEASTDAPSEDAALDAEEDGDVVDATVKCAGALVGGFCWYAGTVGQTCADACQAHGGCNLAGTRDYAGSGGTDANCVAVLAALGYAKWPHQSFSNNDLGCQFAWNSWTYWSAALPTTCEATDKGAAFVHRMCACNE